jgi:hypothetical protein
MRLLYVGLASLYCMFRSGYSHNRGYTLNNLTYMYVLLVAAALYLLCTNCSKEEPFSAKLTHVILLNLLISVQCILDCPMCSDYRNLDCWI